MGTREATISVCGVVLGVIIGAGTVSLVRDIALQASTLGTPVAFRDLPPGQELIKRRNVEAQVQPPDVSRSPTIKPEKTDPPMAKPPRAKTQCDVVKDVVAEIAAAHKLVIPENSDNTEIRQTLRTVLESIVQKHCAREEAVEDAAQDSAGSSSSAVINNKCNKYKQGTLRFTQCKISEQQGKVYKGW